MLLNAYLNREKKKKKKKGKRKKKDQQFKITCKMVHKHLGRSLPGSNNFQKWLSLAEPSCWGSITTWLRESNCRQRNRRENMHLVLPKDMSSNNPILGFCPLPNQAQVNCGGVTCKYAMWWAVLFKMSKNLLL
jgi:hypothetical protein